MPTYEYECSKCGVVFELFQPITEPARKKLRKDDPKPCDCNAAVTRRIGTGGGIIFKGSGFYKTDYRSESYDKAAKADSDSSTKSDGKSEAKSDTAKPAEKKSSKESGKKTKKSTSSD